MKKSERDYIVVQKGWGREVWITNTPKYCGKRMEIQSGKSCSWHYHIKKDEVILVEQGRIEMSYSPFDEVKSATVIGLMAGESFHVSPGVRHRFKALEDSVLYEFSTQHFDSDSIRLIPGD